MTSIDQSARKSTSGAAYHDLSGTFSIIVELLMVVVNFLPLIVIVKWKRYRERTTTDDLIIVLSFSYVVSVLVPTPLGHISYFNQKWYGGTASCNFYQITSNWFRLISMFFVSVLAIDKSFAVHIYRSRNFTARYHGKTKIIVSVVVIIVFTLFVSCLPVMGFGPNNDDSSNCQSWITETPKLQREYLFSYAFLFCGIGNFLCIVVTNLYMVWSVRKVKKSLYSGDRYRSTGNCDVRWQLESTVLLHGVKMVAAVSVLLYTTWFPALVLIFLQKLGVKISDTSVLYALLSTSLSGLLNPIIYGLFDKSYRHGYKKILQSMKLWCRCRRTEFQAIPAVSDPGVPRSASDVVPLSSNRQISEIHRSASGMHNVGFTEITNSRETAAETGATSALLKYINEDKNQNTNEATSLLENSSYFVSSSAFGGPVNMDGNQSSSSSLLSSNFDSQDERSFSSSEEEDEEEEDFDDSVVVESAM